MVGDRIENLHMAANLFPLTVFLLSNLTIRYLAALLASSRCILPFLLVRYTGSILLRVNKSRGVALLEFLVH